MLGSCVVSFRLQLANYLGVDFYDFHIYKFSEFLDPRTHRLMTVQDKVDTVKEMGQHWCTPLERDAETIIVRGGRGAGRRIDAQELQPPPTEWEIQRATLMKVPIPIITQPHEVGPFTRESVDFIDFMEKQICDGSTNPLDFWPKIIARFPTLGRFAMKLFAISATSADTERLFSHAGDVCTPDRSSLKADTINMLTTCNIFLRRDLNLFDHRNVESSRKSLKFAYLTANFDIAYPVDMDALYDSFECADDADYDDEE